MHPSRRHHIRLVLFAVAIAAGLASVVVFKHTPEEHSKYWQEYVAFIEQNASVNIGENAVDVNANGMPIMDAIARYVGFQVQLIGYRDQLDSLGLSADILPNCSCSEHCQRAQVFMRILMNSRGTLPSSVRFHNADLSYFQSDSVPDKSRHSKVDSWVTLQIPWPEQEISVNRNGNRDKAGAVYAE